MSQKDIIAELQAEIDAEEAAASKDAGNQPETEVEAEPEVEASAEGEETEAKGAAGEEAEAEEKPTKGKQPKSVPYSKFSDVNAKARILAKEKADLERRLAELTKPAEAEAKPKTEEDRISEARAQAKAEARLEMQLESFATAGQGEFGSEEFDNACNEIADMGGNINIIRVAIEATDNYAQAAKAVFLLSQEDPDEVTRVLRLSPLKQASTLLKLATARKRSARGDEEDEETEAKPKPKAPVSKAPRPISPISGQARVRDEASDDMTDDEFTKMWNSDPRLGGRPSAN